MPLNIVTRLETKTSGDDIIEISAIFNGAECSPLAGRVVESVMKVIAKVYERNGDLDG